MNDFIVAELHKSADTIRALSEDKTIQKNIATIATECIAALRRGNKILLAGNGGSAADAQHLAAEFVSRFYFDRPGLAAIALTTDTSALTAIGNDYGFERLFSRQIEALGRSGDVLIAISTSGNSPNIITGLKQAIKQSIVTVGLTGHSGGKMLPQCNHCLRMPSSETPKIQEGHIVVGHIICGLVEKEMFSAVDDRIAR